MVSKLCVSSNRFGTEMLKVGIRFELWAISFR